MLQAIRGDRLYKDVSNYPMQLQMYLRHVSRDRVYVLTFEALIADPVKEIQKAFAWLEVDPKVTPPKLDEPVNATPEAIRVARGFGLLREVANSAFYLKHFSWVPLVMRNLGSKLAFRRIARRDVPTAEVEAHLRPIQLRQTEELSALLHRSFPEWTTLYGAAGTTEFAREQSDANGLSNGELRIYGSEQKGGD